MKPPTHLGKVQVAAPDGMAHDGGANVGDDPIANVQEREVCQVGRVDDAAFANVRTLSEDTAHEGLPYVGQA